jgi:hypothetical protein
MTDERLMTVDERELLLFLAGVVAALARGEPTSEEDLRWLGELSDLVAAAADA